MGSLDLEIKRVKEQGEQFGEERILNWFLHISTALKYIHSNRIIHRDIKPENIFLAENGTLKLGDFGISKVLSNTQDMAKTQCGSPFYISPEIYRQEPYWTKSDIWSLGWVLYELCTLNRPFIGDRPLIVGYNVINKEHYPIQEWYSADIRNLIDQLLWKDPSKRPSIDEILEIPFLKEKATWYSQNKEHTADDQNPLTGASIEDRVLAISLSANNKCSNVNSPKQLEDKLSTEDDQSDVANKLPYFSKKNKKNSE